MTNIKLPKRDVAYENDPFIIKTYNYDLQYYPYYKARLAQMTKLLITAAKKQWPYIPIYSLNELADNIEVDKISQDSQDSLDQDNPLAGKDIIVIGVLLKKMSRQPNILKEIDNERKMLQSSAETSGSEVEKNFCSPDDALFLQDGDESIELKGPEVQPGRFCTGVCLAVKGQLNPNGSGFIVEDVCFSTESTTAKIERPLLPRDYYVLIVSGLSFTNDMVSNQKMINSLNIMYDIVAGNSDMVLDQTIVNLIIAGNSISAKTREMSVKNGTEPWNQKSSSAMANSSASVQLLDQFLANVGQTMFVDVMPGHTDLATCLWPQQPLHPCMFPKAFRLTSVRSVTNPHRARYFGVDFLGTSGQNIDAIRSCTTYTDTLEIMRNILQWGHIAPECPDLLHSYPFQDHDPFVLAGKTYPDIFFAGNQTEFSVGSFISSTGADERTVRLISVPAFDEKFIGVMVNLRTLACDMLALN